MSPNYYGCAFATYKNKEDESMMSYVVHNDHFGIRKVKISGIVIDLGANMGLFSVLAAKIFNQKVISVEPFPASFDRLKHHIKINHLEGVVLPINKALGHGGKIKLYIDPKPQSTISNATVNNGYYKESIDVDAITPKELFDMINGKIGYLKVNCEGGEYDLLKFMMCNKKIIDNIDVTYIEHHPGIMPKNMCDEMEIMIKEYISLFKNKPIKISVVNLGDRGLADKYKYLTMDTITK
jgi:FkbM family methyltransferase